MATRSPEQDATVREDRATPLGGLATDLAAASMALARGIRAMIRAAAADHVVDDVVLDILRKEQS